MPFKDPHAPHHIPCGPDRVLDVQFRLLRFESIEGIIEACYHGSQQLYHLASEIQGTDHEYRLVTPRGFRYSFFREVAFEDVSFRDPKGACVRVSFVYPRALRGRRMGPSEHIENGMLVALLGLEANLALSVTFLEVYQRQSTEAMKPRTGNYLRGESPPCPCQCIVNITDEVDQPLLYFALQTLLTQRPSDICFIIRLVYSTQHLPS